MIGLKRMLSDAGVGIAWFQEGDVFDYGLWFKNADYQVRISHYVGDRVDVTLTYKGEDIRHRRHVYPEFDEFLEAFDRIEKDVFADRKTPFTRKPQELWKRLEEAFGEKGNKSL